jgi:DNA-binding MarR family transcriptional regulator
MNRFTEIFIDLYISGRFGEKFNNLQFDAVNSEFSRAERLILFLIYRNGKKKMGDIASNFDIPFSTATVLVDKLVKLRMLKREHSLDDRRVVLIDIDKKGTAYVEQLAKNIDGRLMEMVNLFEEHIQSKLSQEEMAAYYKIVAITKDFFTMPQDK